MSDNAWIMLISSGPPDLSYGGGARRTHQLLHELRSQFGDDAVVHLQREEIVPLSKSLLQRLSRKVKRARARIRDRLENPFQIFLEHGYGQNRHIHHLQKRYLELLAKFPRTRVCIVEHLEFAPLAVLNTFHGIRTFLAPWGLSSMLLNLPYFVPALEAARGRRDTARERLQVRAAFTHLANELLTYAAAERSWFLSKVETGLVHAAGLSASYLPYYPVGKSVDILAKIRAQRDTQHIKTGLFVVNGNNIDQNRMSLDVFIKRLSAEGLPSGAKIVIVGTDRRPASLEAANQPGIIFKGYLPQNEFDALMAKANAVLVPQSCGFGCLTRVPDMLCAGIPVIADTMVADATGKLPGAIYVAEEEGGWLEAMQTAMRERRVVVEEQVKPWFDASRKLVSREFARMAGDT
jgi:hypothetical protein